MYAQELYRQTDAQPYSSSIPVEILKMDMSKSNNENFLPPASSNYLPRQASNGWYPVKGEVYLYNETEIAGYIYNEIGKNGLLDRQIGIGIAPGVYDSTVCLMNRTPYTKGKDLIDTTYNYIKRPDGSYQPELRRTYSYHYFDHFEADSFYYETIYHTWDDVNHRWNNWLRQKRGYHDTLVEFQDRSEEYYGQGNTWKMSVSLYSPVTYDDRGFVDTLYLIFDDVNGLPIQKHAFTYDEHGRYIQIDYFYKYGNNWVKERVHSDITWTEWHGFIYCFTDVIGTERVSPYKRSKVESYYMNDRETFFFYYQKQWDINGTKSNSDTTWRIIDGEMYYSTINDHIYNEYGDYIKYGHTNYTLPDENNEQKMEHWEWYTKRVYDNLYGMTEAMTYLVKLLDDGKMDTTFHSGVKYTEFAPVSITEHPQNKQALQIYPNPASGMVTISATVEMQQLNVFDITGRLVSNQSPANMQLSFDTSILPKGIYLVQARLADGRVQTGKVVVR